MYQTIEEALALREAAVKRHEKFVAHLDNAQAKAATATLLENQVRAQALREADITVGDVPTSVFPAKYAFPLIAQVFPNIVAQKLCQVQPMTAPVGKVFYKSHVKTDDSSFTHGGSYSANTEGGTVVRGKLRFTSTDVTAQKFILQAQWSTEVSEDMRALANLNVEGDLMAALSDEIVGEIDYLILNDIYNGATAGTVAAPAFGSYSYQSHIEHYEEVKNTLIDADVLVTQRRYQRTDYVIGDPAAIARIRKCPGFRSEMPGGSKLGSQRVGVLDQWEVWESANFPVANKLVVGIKGEGYVYAPYIALELMPAMYVSATDDWVRNIRTRAGRKVTMGDAFAIVNLAALS